MQIRRFFQWVVYDRRSWQVLLFVNFFGSLYGFYWYWPQLQVTPLWQWLIVPDSPGSTFLLCIWLYRLLSGADWRKPGMRWLGGIAFLSNMKYGLWTALVLPQAGIKYGWQFDFIHLSISHAGMWLQGALLARAYPPGRSVAVGALLFMWLQDLIDYRVLMTHPTLPYLSERLYAQNVAVLLSTVWGIWLLLRGGPEDAERGGIGRGAP